MFAVIVSSRRRGRCALGSAGLEERHALLQLADLLRFLLLVHAFALEAARPGALARTVALGLRGLTGRPDDKVVKLCEDRRWELVNLQLDFLGALW